MLGEERKSLGTETSPAYCNNENSKNTSEGLVATLQQLNCLQIIYYYFYFLEAQRPFKYISHLLFFIKFINRLLYHENIDITNPQTSIFSKLVFFSIVEKMRSLRPKTNYIFICVLFNMII